MRALVKYAEGSGALELREVQEPVAGPGDVKIRVCAAGVCGTDVHIYHGRYPVRPPIILGHEFAGTIAQLGDGVEGWQIGDRVTAAPFGWLCGVCRYCRAGRPALCINRRALSARANGAFAEYVVAPAQNLFALPDNVDFHSGALCEPLACVVHAVSERVRLAASDLVVVLGPGPIGLLAMQVARAEGARVIVCGTAADAERLALARDLGADGTVSPETMESAIAEESDGYGADVAIECSGSPEALEAGLRTLRKGGHLLLVGLAEGPAPVDLLNFVLKELSIIASFGHTWTAWRRTAELLGRGTVVVRPLITNVLPLASWEEAFANQAGRRGIKTVLVP